MNRLTPRQVCDCARQLQNPVIRPCREIQLAHGCADQAFAGFIEFAVLAHFCDEHAKITKDIGALKALKLALSRGVDTRADTCRGFTKPIAAEFIVIDPRYFNMDVNLVEQ